MTRHASVSGGTSGVLDLGMYRLSHDAISPLKAGAGSLPDFNASDVAASGAVGPLNMNALPVPPPPLSILLFRTPIPSSEGTDPYHDAFGSFCLPSFPMSALESGSSTPLPPPINPNTLSGPMDRSGAEILKSALNLSTTGRRRGRWIVDDPTLTTHHLMSKDGDEVKLLNRLTEMTGGNQVITNALMDDAIEYCVSSIPILTTSHVNLQELVERMINGTHVVLPQYPLETGSAFHAAHENENGATSTPQSGDVQAKQRVFKQQMRYRGVIVTSQRAADAWVKAARMAANRLIEEASARGESHTTPPLTLWPRIPFFAVGPATANALKNAAITLPTPFRPRLVLGGVATGTGESLANYVIKHFADGPGSRPPGYCSPGNRSPVLTRSTILDGKSGADISIEGEEAQYTGPPPIEPLLILTGDKNLPTIRNMLSTVRRPRPTKEDGSAGCLTEPATTTVAPAAGAAADTKPLGRRMISMPKSKELWEMSPIPFEELQVYETSEDPEFDAHLRSFEQSLPPGSSRPNSRRPSASESDGGGTNTGLLSALSGPPPNMLSAAISGAASGSPGTTALQALDPSAPAASSGSAGGSSIPASEGSISTPSSASVSRRSSIKAKILAERLNVVNKGVLANGLPSPLMSGAPLEGSASALAPGVTSTPLGGASTAPGTHPGPGARERAQMNGSAVGPGGSIMMPAAVHATPAFLQAAGGEEATMLGLQQKADVGAMPVAASESSSAVGSATHVPGTDNSATGASVLCTLHEPTMPSPLLGKSLHPSNSQAFVSSALSLEPIAASDYPIPGVVGAGICSGNSSGSGNINGTGAANSPSSGGSWNVTPGGYRASGSAPSQAHENKLGTLDEDSALTDEALLEHAITAQQNRVAQSHKPDWIVFFSPSGVQYALPHLRCRKWIPPEPPAEAEPPPIDAKPGAGSKYPRIAVLGPTTKSWVRHNLHILPDAVAASPAPTELREAINLVEKKRRIERMKQLLEEKENVNEK
ncbi:hypothetical protein K437DRAFT_3752 [Tilletiaria anomala UBC 951]|uniref:Tetrapyrrole biosynthesis uroporphyrinogen III synthase domain-containing protein n=1 Tax=Tilletiaria anomala (strain ATCC 24038 / CBS 436.72 / UBC 951) TaxID=1037660 RepID=A0A066WSG3_TILAU|nr:uncharacterized protein K437DRAFT_3752 [Tilletiaria anomala UBC 951]KDN53625.1 hypothetical protein K437DRAFT_3752 [Tilletiaria anomala UBC 951]